MASENAANVAETRITAAARVLRIVGRVTIAFAGFQLVLGVYLYLVGIRLHDAEWRAALDVCRLIGAGLAVLAARALMTRQEWGRMFCLYAVVVGVLFNIRDVVVLQHSWHSWLTIGPFLASAFFYQQLTRPDIAAAFRRTDSAIPRWMTGYLATAAVVAVATSFR